MTQDALAAEEQLILWRGWGELCAVVLRMRTSGLEGAWGVGVFCVRARARARESHVGPGGAGGWSGLEHPATSVCGSEPIPRSRCREGALWC